MLQGSIPDSIVNCSNLRILDLSRNSLVGEIPPGVGLLSNLSVLRLSWNNLTGIIPPTISNITSLEILGIISRGSLAAGCQGGIRPRPCQIWGPRRVSPRGSGGCHRGAVAPLPLMPRGMQALRWPEDAGVLPRSVPLLWSASVFVVPTLAHGARGAALLSGARLRPPAPGARPHRHLHSNSWCGSSPTCSAASPAQWPHGGTTARP